jgi:hypothetical protein
VTSGVFVPFRKTRWRPPITFSPRAQTSRTKGSDTRRKKKTENSNELSGRRITDLCENFHCSEPWFLTFYPSCWYLSLSLSSHAQKRKRFFCETGKRRHTWNIQGRRYSLVQRIVCHSTLLRSRTSICIVRELELTMISNAAQIKKKNK